MVKTVENKIKKCHEQKNTHAICCDYVSIVEFFGFQTVFEIKKNINKIQFPEPNDGDGFIWIFMNIIY